MEAMLQSLMEKADVSGLAVGHAKAQQLKTYCIGNFEGQEITATSVWPVASLTKPVFVYGVLQLVQQGLLDLDAPLQSYLNEAYPTEDVAYLSQISARHAMSHSSGFPNWRDNQGLRIAFPPGERFSYSSEGLNYMQIVVEKLLGQTMAHYLKDHVFRPAGMHDSSLRPESAGLLPLYLQDLAQRLPANGALSLWTTIADYTRFMMKMMLDDPSLPHKMMLQPQHAVGRFSDLYWGLGWGLQGEGAARSFWHWGSRGIPRTMNFALGWPARQEALVIFTNHAEGLYLCREIIQNLYPDMPVRAFDWLLPAEDWTADGLGRYAQG